MANGTIAFDTLQTSGQITGTAKSVDTDYVVNGSAKHWVNFTGESTPTVRDSLNAGSITDNGTGDYTIAITNNMGNGNYSISTGLASYNGDNDYRFPTFIKSAAQDDWSTMATSSYRLQNNQVNNGASATDPSLVNKTIHGDLA
jgi:hypothetical protein